MLTRGLARSVSTGIAVFALVVLPVSPASAKKPVCGKSVCTVIIKKPPTPPEPAVPAKPGSTTGVTPDPCQYLTVDPSTVTGPARDEYDRADPKSRGVIGRKNCSGVPGEESFVYVPPTKPQPPTVGTAAQTARGRLPIPAPCARACQLTG